MRRRSLVVLMAGAVAVSALATWAAAVRIHSPAEVAARTAPPAASPILAPVVEQVLTNQVVTRGTGNYGSPQSLRVAPSGLKPGRRVVTSLPRVGSRVAAGDVLLTLSGRPVLVLEGAQPSYRDLGPGISGEDVRQLESGLEALGLGPGQVDGFFDWSTGDALRRLYERHGFAPVTATEDQLSRARPAEAAVVPGAWATDGVQLPSDELVFVDTTPLRITELPTPLGKEPSGALVTVTSSEVVVEGALPVEQAGMVTRGAEVIIDEPLLGLEAVGSVTQLAGRPGTNGADGFHVAFEVAVAKTQPGLVGTSVRLVIPIESTRRAELTVPVSAVTLGADGGARVERSGAEGTTHFVAVETGLSADGFVAVTPQSGELAEGDMVVVGLDAAEQPGG